MLSSSPSGGVEVNGGGSSGGGRQESSKGLLRRIFERKRGEFSIERVEKARNHDTNIDGNVDLPNRRRRGKPGGGRQRRKSQLARRCFDERRNGRSGLT